jgi:hypothetical protein
LLRGATPTLEYHVEIRVNDEIVRHHAMYALAVPAAQQSIAPIFARAPHYHTDYLPRMHIVHNMCRLQPQQWRQLHDVACEYMTRTTHTSHWFGRDYRLYDPPFLRLMALRHMNDDALGPASVSDQLPIDALVVGDDDRGDADATAAQLELLAQLDAEADADADLDAEAEADAEADAEAARVAHAATRAAAADPFVEHASSSAAGPFAGRAQSFAAAAVPRAGEISFDAIANPGAGQLMRARQDNGGGAVPLIVRANPAGVAVEPLKRRRHGQLDAFVSPHPDTMLPYGVAKTGIIARMRAEMVDPKDREIRSLNAELDHAQGVLSATDPLVIDATNKAHQQFATDGNGPRVIDKRRAQLGAKTNRLKSLQAQLKVILRDIGITRLQCVLLESKVQMDDIYMERFQIDAAAESKRKLAEFTRVAIEKEERAAAVIARKRQDRENSARSLAPAASSAFTTYRFVDDEAEEDNRPDDEIEADMFD